MRKLGTSVLSAALGLMAIAALAAPAGADAAACPGTPDAYSKSVLANEPIAYYRLDEASGPTLCDSSSAHANGSYKPTGIAFGQPGALQTSSDGAVSLSGPSSGIGEGGPGLTGDHSFTLEAWFKASAAVPAEQLLDMGQGAKGDIAGLGVCTGSDGAFKCDPSGDIMLDTYESITTWATQPVGVNLFDNSWHQLDVSYDAATGQATAYLDGVGLGAKAPPMLNLAASNIRLGYWVDTAFNQPFVGSADEIAVYPSALPAAGVLTHYEASGQKSHSATQVICNLDVTSGIDTCGATVGDAGTGPNNPSGHVKFSIVPNSGTKGTFPDSSSCNLKATPGSGNVSFCAVRFKPAFADTDFPHIRAAYSGDALRLPSSADTAFLKACVAFPPSSPINSVMGQSLLGATSAQTSAVAIGRNEAPSYDNPVMPCEGQPRLLPGYLDPPTTSDQTIAPIGGGKFGPIGSGLTGQASESAIPAMRSTTRSRKKRAGGATIRYRLKGPAAVTFWVARISPRKHGHARLALVRGDFTLTSRAGENTFKFSGWIGKHKLKPGSYVLIARPFFQGSVGIPHTMRFRIVRGSH
jgi:Concanavalin A-like lectin/glucanases superfamily